MVYNSARSRYFYEQPSGSKNSFIDSPFFISLMLLYTNRDKCFCQDNKSQLRPANIEYLKWVFPLVPTHFSANAYRPLTCKTDHIPISPIPYRYSPVHRQVCCDIATILSLKCVTLGLEILGQNCDTLKTASHFISYMESTLSTVLMSLLLSNVLLFCDFFFDFSTDYCAFRHLYPLGLEVYSCCRWNKSLNLKLTGPEGNMIRTLFMRVLQGKEHQPMLGIMYQSSAKPNSSWTYLFVWFAIISSKFKEKIHKVQITNKLSTTGTPLSAVKRCYFYPIFRMCISVLCKCLQCVSGIPMER